MFKRYKNGQPVNGEWSFSLRVMPRSVKEDRRDLQLTTCYIPPALSRASQTEIENRSLNGDLNAFV